MYSTLYLVPVPGTVPVGVALSDTPCYTCSTVQNTMENKAKLLIYRDLASGRLKLHEVLSRASPLSLPVHPLSTTSTLYSFIAYRYQKWIKYEAGCDVRIIIDATEDLGIDDCSTLTQTHPSLPTADCRLPVRLTVLLMKVLIWNLQFVYYTGSIWWCLS